MPFILAGLVLLGACDGSKPAPGGNVTMRDMEVVDGTANDSMTDLDNATTDGTLLANGGMTNGGELPDVGAASAGNAAATNSASPPERKSDNSSAAE